MRTGLLLDFYQEVNRNRSALLFKDFDSTWGFLGLNPDILNDKNALVCHDWFKNVFQFKFIREILKRNNSNEILLHRETSLNDEDLLYALENLALKNNKNWNTSSPYLSTKVRFDGESFRMTLIHPQITNTERPGVFFRRLRANAIELSTYSGQKILEQFVSERKNVIICGGTGSGKTTLLQSLLNLCPASEHLVILEDTNEITLKDKNTTHLLSSENASLLDFCSYALRISPSRIILGELRGPEVVPLVLAMNTGHKGFMTTIHANSAPECLSRLRTLLEFYAPKNSQSFSMICQNIDAIIYMEGKKIIEIISVMGLDESTPLFDYLFRCEREPVREAL
jgi:type IV secretion system protein VirB11